jgi:hypothetical protein
LHARESIAMATVGQLGKIAVREIAADELRAVVAPATSR